MLSWACGLTRAATGRSVLSADLFGRGPGAALAATGPAGRVPDRGLRDRHLHSLDHPAESVPAIRTEPIKESECP